ncbi:STAS domain-containing protein [Rhizobium jaguaris]|uniref:Anti-sigma factor antagonist n=1 Tax=Rhizobium jaguaris TaxID=1312183 RepID=A0A387FU19_9HYPH|nr:STAS domain-containing protein [Rhizobium jaguaris]AYG61903.1 anti-sigma factor antagonist [Rhizobium jaguaris]
MLELADSFENGATIVHASGKLDTLTAKSFETHLRAHVETGSGPLLVDMQAIDYVSSFGLRSLLIIAKQMAPYGRKFILFSPNTSVLEVLRVSGFLRIISVADSKATALADISEAAVSDEQPN